MHVKSYERIPFFTSPFPPSYCHDHNGVSYVEYVRIVDHVQSRPFVDSWSRDTDKVRLN